MIYYKIRKIKKTLFLLITAIVLILTANPVFAQNETEIEAGENVLYATFSYGAAASWLTRIINQTDRSNFVYRDFLSGLYFCTELNNIPHITPSVRVAAYYPFISTFNHVPQKPNTPLHYALDIFAGARIETGWEFINANAGLGLHMFYLSSDRWNYFNVGIAAAAGIELAISAKWSLLLDGFASLDNGNLGGNRYMEPFNVTWQYQIGLGVRYSKAKQNNSALFQTGINSSLIDQ